MPVSVSRQRDKLTEGAPGVVWDEGEHEHPTKQEYPCDGQPMRKSHIDIQNRNEPRPRTKHMNNARQCLELFIELEVKL